MIHSTNWRRRALRVAPAIALATTLVACGGDDDQALTDSNEQNAAINFFSNPDNSGATEKVVAACNAQSGGSYTIVYQQLPSASDQQHEQLARRLSAQDNAIDIMAMDVNWTAEFAAAGWAEEWTGENETAVSEGTLEGPLDTATYDGKLYGAPSNSNTQLLWYRKDLVPTPPRTWDEMISMATALNQQGRPHLIEIQGAKYEGLTVWFNTLANSAGAGILNEEGEAANVGAHTQRAAEIMRNLATSPAADPSLPNQQEDQNRLAFESGQAAFQLNYPFVYPSAQRNAPQLAQNMAWAPYPSVNAGEPAKVTIGGINLAVSAFSRNQTKAFEAVKCLRNSENQKVLAVEGGLPPTLSALYDDPAVIAEYPFAKEIRDGLQNASVRPKTPQYSAVSLAIQNTLSPPSAIDPASVNQRLEQAINNALGARGLQ